MDIELDSFQSNGERCAASWYWPDHTNERLPCVVLCHGFSATRDWILPDFASRFAAAGIATFTFDYRGLGDSEGSPRQVVALQAQRADVRAALVHVRSNARIDARRVALWGTSLGGSHALAAAAEDSTIVALILNIPGIDALRGVNFEEKRKRAGVSRVHSAAVTLRLLIAALRDRLAAARGKPPVYLAVYGPPGEAFFTDPEQAERFERLAASSATWKNRVAARFLLDAPRYREGTFERITAPIMICLAERDIELSNSFVRAKAAAARSVDIRVYAAGHFDLYHEPTFAQLVADQTVFLQAHTEARATYR